MAHNVVARLQQVDCVALIKTAHLLSSWRNIKQTTTVKAQEQHKVE